MLGAALEQQRLTIKAANKKIVVSILLSTLKTLSKVFEDPRLFIGEFFFCLFLFCWMFLSNSHKFSLHFDVFQSSTVIFPSYNNHSTDFNRKSINWFLYIGKIFVIYWKYLDKGVLLLKKVKFQLGEPISISSVVLLQLVYLFCVFDIFFNNGVHLGRVK